MHARRILVLCGALLLLACAGEGELEPVHATVVTQLEDGALVPAPRAQSQQARHLADAVDDELAAIAVEYPLDDSVFPPDLVAPTLLWKDATPSVDGWLVQFDVEGDSDIQIFVPGVPPPVGEIDAAVIAPTNELPEGPAPDERSWRPDEETWDWLTQGTTERWATVTITGFARDRPTEPLSRGRFRFKTSQDPVGAPIFYRDVPLAPATTTRGVIKPLAEDTIGLIRWRLRDVSKRESRVVLEDMVTCANCHSFSRDGKTFGMDVDGPDGDKGTYAVVPVEPQMTIDYEDIVSWNDYPENRTGLNTLGFLSRVSPDGRYVVSTVNESVFVANFADYRFLQVFFPTRGTLAWLDTQTRAMKSLPGADDPTYVHCSPVWTPDGNDLVYSRAIARDPYEKGKPLPTYANDPNEPQIQYDLVRIPFDGGRGGTPTLIQGASRNGMSNTFPKVSPDGKWIVYTRCRNGLLMRPDSRLWIVPTAGGEAREMLCNTKRMNSWHSWSPNGRWLVFSSKARSHYTQMYLTHVDEDGKDTPAILIPNSTAANRAVNLPEFLNAPYDAMESIDVPGVRHRRDMQRGTELIEAGRRAEALTFFQRAVAANPENADARGNLGWALTLNGRHEDAVVQFQQVLRIAPTSMKVHLDLGRALFETGRIDDSIRHTRTYLEAFPYHTQARRNLASAYLVASRLDDAMALLDDLFREDPNDLETRRNLALLHLRRGRAKEALPHLERVLRWQPDDLGVTNALAWQLASSPDDSLRDGRRAVALAERMTRIAPQLDANQLDTLAAAYAEAGRFDEAVATAEKALTLNPDARLAAELEQRRALYRARTPYRYPRPR